MANTCTTEICQKVIALMKEGLTQQEVCAEIGIGARTIRDWKDKRSPQYEKEFDEAYQEGKMYQQAWWLKTGRT
jgi:transposase